MTASAEKSPEHHRGLAALLAALTAVGPFSVDAYLPSMPEISRNLGAPMLAVQQTLTAYMVPFALMTLWHGAISDALGRRRVILWGTALFAVASTACACAHSVQQLLWFRALQGMTAGAGMVVGRAIVRDLFHGAEAQRVMSQVSLTFAIAPAIAPVIGGWLQAWFGWRAVFVFLVLFAGLAWLLCRFVLPETLPPERRRSMHPVYLARSYWGVFTSFRFVALCGALTLNFTGLFIYVASAPVYLIQHLHVPATGFLWLFGPATAGIATGSWLSGKFAGRMTATRTLGYAYGAMGVAMLANLALSLAMPPTLPWAVLPIFVYVIGLSLAAPTLTLLALDLFPAQRGLAASCQSFAQTTGAALNAIFVPLVWGSVVSLAITQGVALALGLGALWFYLRRSRVEPMPVLAKPLAG